MRLPFSLLMACWLAGCVTEVPFQISTEVTIDLDRLLSEQGIDPESAIPGDIDKLEFEVATDVDFSAGNSSFVEYRDRAEYLEFNYVVYSLLENSLSLTTAPISIYMAPLGVRSSSSAAAQFFGRTRTMEAGKLVTNVPIHVAVSGESKANELLHHLGAALVFKLVVPVAEGSPPPRGRITMNLVVDAIVAVEPFL